MDIDPNIVKNAPGLLGAAGAAAISKTGWGFKFTIFILGLGAAWVGAAYGSKYAEIPEQLSGFLIGFFFPPVALKVVDTWNAFDLSSAMNTLWARFFGGKKE